ncbi:MAG: hypothetical protein NWE93_02195 [Candidatus Bathyarchaeota archaeon]|nr:hypothetical protein [Candidatus Bathyarchaeota archaeon]
MQSSVAALLLVTSAVVLSCVTVTYSVELMQQSISADTAQMDLLNTLQDSLLNQTSIINGTVPGLPSEPAPTPLPDELPDQ